MIRPLSQHVNLTGHYRTVHFVGDVHSNLVPFEKAVRALQKNDPDFRRSSTALALLGDVAGKGHQLKQVLDYLRRCEDIYDAVYLLEGNHDHALMQILTPSGALRPDDYQWFLRAHGWGIIACYLEDVLSKEDQNQLVKLGMTEVFCPHEAAKHELIKRILSDEMRLKLLKAIKNKGHLSFFEMIKTSIVFGALSASHTGGFPNLPLKQQPHESVTGVLDDKSRHRKLQQRHTEPFPEAEARIIGHIPFVHKGRNKIRVYPRVVQMDTDKWKGGLPCGAMLKEKRVVFTAPHRPPEIFDLTGQGFVRVGQKPENSFVMDPE